jgi:hypothetical protein
MQIDKQQIIEFLKSRGDQGKVDQAQSELPDQVDTDQHAGLLERFGVNPADLIATFTGGQARGGIGGALGKRLSTG